MYQTAIKATKAALMLPITADQGCASGEFGTQNSSTAVAPKGATR
jgi:hypothetical protein